MLSQNLKKIQKIEVEDEELKEEEKIELTQVKSKPANTEQSGTEPWCLELSSLLTAVLFGTEYIVMASCCLDY